jgi:hypothetical protein
MVDEMTNFMTIQIVATMQIGASFKKALLTSWSPPYRFSECHVWNDPMHVTIALI